MTHYEGMPGKPVPENVSDNVVHHKALVCVWFCSLGVGSWQMFFWVSNPENPEDLTALAMTPSPILLGKPPDQAICLVWLCHRKRAMDMVPHPVPNVFSSTCQICQHVIHLACRLVIFVLSVCFLWWSQSPRLWYLLEHLTGETRLMDANARLLLRELKEQKYQKSIGQTWQTMRNYEKLINVGEN